MALIEKMDRKLYEDVLKQMDKDIKNLKESVDEALIKKTLEWESKYTEMKKRCDRLEKELKRNNIIVFGVEPPDYDLVGFVVKIVNRYMDLGLTVDDVNDVYAVGPADKKKIVVSLVSYIKKREILSGVRKLRGTGITIAEEVTLDNDYEKNRKAYDLNEGSGRTYRATYSDIRVDSPDSQRSEDEITRMYEEISQYRVESEEEDADSDGSDCVSRE